MKSLFFALALSVLFSVGCVSRSLPPSTAEYPTGVLVWLVRPDVDPRVFGKSESAVRQYIQYWRTAFREGPQRYRAKIIDAGSGNYWAGLQQTVDDYYAFDRFRDSAAILHEALERETEADTLLLLQKLLITHRLAELAYTAAVLQRESLGQSELRVEAETAQKRFESLLTAFGAQSYYPLHRQQEQTR